MFNLTSQQTTSMREIRLFLIEVIAPAAILGYIGVTKIVKAIKKHNKKKDDDPLDYTNKEDN